MINEVLTHVCFCSAEREVVLSNLDTLCSVALGEKVAEDYLLARDTLITVANITDHLRVSTQERIHSPEILNVLY